MAGARPEHLPVILAIAATGEPAFPSSTAYFGRLILVNGPIRHELRMNSGVGALSPMNPANSVIGRAWTLMTINLGNTKVGETFLGSQGNNFNYNNMRIAEKEEKSVWEPFHVEKGFEPVLLFYFSRSGEASAQLRRYCLICLRHEPKAFLFPIELVAPIIRG